MSDVNIKITIQLSKHLEQQVERLIDVLVTAQYYSDEEEENNEDEDEDQIAG